MKVPAIAMTQGMAGEVRRVLRLALPLVMGQVAMMGMAVVDVMVAGSYGTDDIAAVTIGFYAWDLTIMFVLGIVLANSALIGHAYGAGDVAGVRRQFQQCLWLGVPLSLFSGLLLYLAMHSVGWLDLTPAVAKITADYLLPSIFASMLIPFTIGFRSTNEGLGLTKPVMWLSLGVFMLHIPLDYALVHGLIGLPPLGGAGCGWASLAAFSLLLVCWIIYSLRAPALRRFQLWRDFSGPRRKEILAMLSLGVPIGLSLLGVGGFFSLIPLMMAPLGTVAIAGHSVAATFDTMLITIPLGVGQAMSVRVAHELGAGRALAARKVCTTGMALLIGIALLQALLTIAFRHEITRLFTVDPAVRALGATLLIYAAAYRLFDSVQIGAGMTLRGYKDTRVSSVIDLTAYWVFGLPLCYFLGLRNPMGLRLGVQGFWIGMLTAIVVAASLLALRLHRTSRRAVEDWSGLIAMHETRPP